MKDARPRVVMASANPDKVAEIALLMEDVLDIAPPRAALSNLQNRLKSKVPPYTMRWDTPQNLHLTLHFLGDIEENEIPKIELALQQSATTLEPFKLTIGQLGCFPNIQRPRVVWAGVLGNTKFLRQLHQTLGAQLNQTIGFIPETRPYSPHLTLGRVKKGIPTRHMRRLGQILGQQQTQIKQIARVKVAEVSLMRSELTPTGPIYTKLLAVKLQAPTNGRER
ncbi:MAG: RNA 2',3'-cyclic phosphodiesterase [Chloroflexota bacterium]